MAVFPRPVNALRAILSAQRTLGSPPNGTRPLLLKAGIHQGHCVAVTLNDRLDYFGSTVNIAARLEGFSVGGDAVISAVVRADPEVCELLAQLRITSLPNSLSPTSKASLKRTLHCGVWHRSLRRSDRLKSKPADVFTSAFASSWSHNTL